MKGVPNYKRYSPRSTPMKGVTQKVTANTPKIRQKKISLKVKNKVKY